MIFTAMLALLPTAFAIAAGAPGRLGRVSSNAGPAICPTLKTAPVYSITDCAKGDLKAVYSEKAEVSLTCFVTGEAVGENV